LKKEIGIINNPPYYALIPKDGCVGSKHNYSFFNDNYEQYKDFCRKCESDFNLVPEDDGFGFWKIMVDRAYYTN